MTKNDALSAAARLKKTLMKKGMPIKQVYLFGSYAIDKATKDSDIDIAIVCEPFLKSKWDEGAEMLLASKDIDLKIQTIAFHPKDMGNKYSTIIQEVKKYGIPVED